MSFDKTFVVSILTFAMTKFLVQGGRAMERIVHSNRTTRRPNYNIHAHRRSSSRVWLIRYLGPACPGWRHLATGRRVERQHDAPTVRCAPRLQPARESRRRKSSTSLPNFFPARHRGRPCFGKAQSVSQTNRTVQA